MSILLVIGLIAVIGALAVIGLVVYLIRTKTNGNKPGSTKDLTPEQADEISSTWNLLNH